MCIRDRYRCGRTIGHLTVGEFTVTGVLLLMFAFLVSSWEMNGKAERRWLGTSLCDNERTIALRKNALRVYEGKSSELIPRGPRSRVGTIQLNWVTSAYCPNVTDLRWEAGKRYAAVVGVRHQPKAMGDSTAAGGARAQGACGVHPARLGKPGRWWPSRWPAES